MGCRMVRVAIVYILIVVCARLRRPETDRVKNEERLMKFLRFLLLDWLERFGFKK